MPKWPKVPDTGSPGNRGSREFGDAIRDVYEMYRIEAQVRQDAIDYQLTTAEIAELKDAYYLESLSLLVSGDIPAAIRFINRKKRSSGEILKKARERQQNDKKPRSENNSKSLETFFRESKEVVDVSAYSRGENHVQAHTRTKPDGSVSNNFSFRK